MEDRRGITQDLIAEVKGLYDSFKVLVECVENRPDQKPAPEDLEELENIRSRVNDTRNFYVNLFNSQIDALEETNAADKKNRRKNRLTAKRLNVAFVDSIIESYLPVELLSDERIPINRTKKTASQKEPDLISNLPKNLAIITSPSYKYGLSLYEEGNAHLLPFSYRLRPYL